MQEFEDGARLRVLVVLVSLCFVAASWASLADSGAAVLERKTFDRWPDPVVADCGLLTSLVGKKIEFVRVYADAKGSFQPIPFQIDEKDTQGHYIYPAGEKPNLQDANGLIDSGEELVFMARDCGGRVKPAAFPPGVQLYEELELQDPLTQGRGWVYVLYSEASPPRPSGEDYIEYVPEHRGGTIGDCQIMKSRYCEVRFFPQKPYFDTSKYPNNGFAHSYMAISPEGGGTYVNCVERFKARLTLAFMFGVLKFRFNEGSATFYESAYKDGPVRLIRNLQIILSMPLGIKAPGLAVDLLWYDTIVDVPLVIDLPFNPKYVLSYLELRLGEDHSSNAIGMKVYNSNNPLGCEIDGRIDGEAERNWKTGRDQWRLITGKQGTIMNRSFWDDHYLKQIKWIRVDYLDDTELDDSPEDVRGVLGMIPQTNRVEGIKKDRYHSYLEWYFPPSFLMTGPGRTYRAGDEKSYLDIADHPVNIKAGENSMQSHYFGKMPAFDRAEKIIEKQRASTVPVQSE